MTQPTNPNLSELEKQKRAIERAYPSKPLPRFVNARALGRIAAEVLLPPRRMKVSECASKHRYINNAGAYIGPWQHSVAPYMIDPMNAISSRELEGVIFVGSAQSLKTSGLIENAILYTIICDPVRTVVVEKTQTDAREFSRERMDQMNRDCPEVKRRLSPNRRDDNVFDKRYRGDMTLTLAWPTENALAGKAIARVFIPDYDRLKGSIGGEGEAFDLGRKRTTTFGTRGITVAESSPSKPLTVANWKAPANTPNMAPPTTGGILSLYNRGDRRRCHWPCPSCGIYFEGSFSTLEYPDPATEGISIDEAAARVNMICPNGCVITPDQRAWMSDQSRLRWPAEGQTIDQGGNYVGDGITSTIMSFWAKGPVATFQTWPSLVRNYLQALDEYERTGNEEPLRTTTNVDQCEPYLEMALANERKLDADELKTRSEVAGLTPRTIHSGVRFLVALVDVQMHYFDVQIQGYGVNAETWVIDKYRLSTLPDNIEDRLFAPATFEDDWDTLINAVILKTYPLDDGSGRVMQIKLTGIDMHGAPGVSSQAMEFWKRAKAKGLGNKIRLTRGDGRPDAPRVIETYPDSQRKDRHAGGRGEVPVLGFNTSMLKDEVFTALQLEQPGARYIHFADGLTGDKGTSESYFAEVCAEVRTTKGWKREHVRNEAFDQLYMAKGLYLFLKCDRRSHWLKPPRWADVWDNNTLISSAPVDGEDTDPLTRHQAARPKGGMASQLANLNT